jgi:DtxR family Mn-dependent transcriptional regulator
MPSATAENYLKHIYVLAEAAPEKPVSMGLLAERMQVVPGTATSMVKALHRHEWVAYEPRVGVSLTETGRREALRVLRKHRILEMFLVEVLKLDWTEVHEEAELLEHSLTEKLVDRMDAFLGNPEVDPHGDPIPSPSGQLRSTTVQQLPDLQTGERARVSRILQQDPEFLEFLRDQGLMPGAEVQVTAQRRLADVVEVQTADGNIRSLGGAVTSGILVEPVPGPQGRSSTPTGQ